MLKWNLNLFTKSWQNYFISYRWFPEYETANTACACGCKLHFSDLRFPSALFFKVLILLSDVEDVMLEDTDLLDEELAIACSIKWSFLWSYKSKCNIDVKFHQDLGERSHS